MRITDDPEIEARLRELAEYAHSIGLYPPGNGPTMDPPITLVWLPGMPFEEDGIPMWSAHPDQDDSLDED